VFVVCKEEGKIGGRKNKEGDTSGNRQLGAGKRKLSEEKKAGLNVHKPPAPLRRKRSANRETGVLESGRSKKHYHETQGEK